MSIRVLNHINKRINGGKIHPGTIHHAGSENWREAEEDFGDAIDYEKEASGSRACFEMQPVEGGTPC